MKEKGILLLSTLFFIVVLIMMSVALFGLTQSNFKTLKDYDSRQKASLHAENSIQILTFLIMHNNSAFKIKNDNTLIPLRDSMLIPKILSNNDFNNNLPYFYSIIDLSNGGIVETNNSSYNPFNYGSSSNGYLIILWDKKYGNDPTKEGSIIFFGNYMNDTSSADYPNNRYNNNGLANSILISFNENTRKVDVSFTAGTFPLYSSYNRLKVSTDDSIQGDVKVNGRRIQKEYMLDIMAMGYSKVPSTSRYVVTYIDQCFINKGYNFIGSLVTDGKVDIEMQQKLRIGTYKEYQNLNQFIGSTHSTILTSSNTNQFTKFYTVEKQDSNTYNIKETGIQGKIIAKENSGHSLKAFISNKQQTFSKIEPTSSEDATAIKGNQSTYNSIKNLIGAEIEVNNNMNSQIDKVRNRILNQVSSKFGSNNYVELNPGYYVFISDDTLVYFPPSYNQVLINNYLKNAVTGYSIDQSKLPSDSIIMTSNLLDKYGRVINEIYMESFNLVIGKNIKISDTGKFLYITSWYNSSYPFGYNEISLLMENGSILWYDKGAIVIDGIVNNDPEKGGGIIATADSTNNSLIQQVLAPTYIRNNDTVINKYWSSYRASGSGTSITLTESGKSTISSSLKQGDIVARFSQFSQGTQNTAILADNDIYINPLYQSKTDIQQYINILNKGIWENKIGSVSINNSYTSSGLQSNGSWLLNTGTYAGTVSSGINFTIDGKNYTFVFFTKPYTYTEAITQPAYDPVTGEYIGEEIIGYNTYTDNTRNESKLYIDIYSDGIKVNVNPLTLSLDEKSTRIVIDALGASIGTTSTNSSNDIHYKYGKEKTAQAIVNILSALQTGKIDYVTNWINTSNDVGHSNLVATVTRNGQTYDLIGIVYRQLGWGNSNSQKEREKQKRGMTNYEEKSTDIKLYGLILSKGKFRALTGVGNNLFITGMLMTGQGINIKGTNNIEFFFDPSILDSIGSGSKASLLESYSYRIYDKLQK